MEILFFCVIGNKISLEFIPKNLFYDYIYTFILYRFHYKEKNIFYSYLSEYFGSEISNQLDKSKSFDKNYILFYYKLKKIYKILVNTLKSTYQLNQSYKNKKNKNYKKYNEKIKNIKNNYPKNNPDKLLLYI
jgi:hypothetical protein